MTKQDSCFFSGHRILENKEMRLIKSLLREEILNKINEGVTQFIVGGAIGFDTLAAEQVIDMRDDYNDIRLILYLPCRNHFARWRNAEKERFYKICEKADEVRYITGGNYSSGCMRKRNLAMVEAADCGIVYLSKRINSGSAQTVKFAKEKGIPFVNIADEVNKYADLG